MEAKPRVHLSGNTAFPNIIDAPLPRKASLVKVSQHDYNAIFKGVTADDSFAGRAQEDDSLEQAEASEQEDEEATGSQTADQARFKTILNFKNSMSLLLALRA